MDIKSLIKAVREQNLLKDQLENYYTELTALYAEMSLRIADLEKEEALYLNECGEKTRAGAERLWNATDAGQEQITLKHNLRAIEKLASSVKHRIYNYL